MAGAVRLEGDVITGNESVISGQGPDAITPETDDTASVCSCTCYGPSTHHRRSTMQRYETVRASGRVNHSAIDAGTTSAATRKWRTVRRTAIRGMLSSDHCRYSVPRSEEAAKIRSTRFRTLPSHSSARPPPTNRANICSSRRVMTISTTSNHTRNAHPFKATAYHFIAPTLTLARFTVCTFETILLY